LKPNEIESLQENELGKVIEKTNLGREGQKVLVFGGKDSAAVEKAKTANKMLWMSVLRDWFDLQINWEDMTY
jgi:hypothetical protein